MKNENIIAPVNFYPKYEFADDPKKPANVYLKGQETPVWIQQRWTEGEFSKFVQENGCGHCCVAMAAKLHGVDIDPHREFELCCTLWGMPDLQKKYGYMTVAGVAKILNHLGIPAIAKGTAEQGTKAASEDICLALKEGKMAIMISVPKRYPDNPFSPGGHYILAVGYTEDGRILIANSTIRAKDLAIQFASFDMIERALPENTYANPALTWGEPAVQSECYGYVIVG
ncbi:MAG: C39 family peptidase [Clostridia bacterium]|nr:C39 family peptidase [Clostridia bacterium]